MSDHGSEKLSSSSFVSRSTSQNFWMSFPRTSWVSSLTTLSSRRRTRRWRWSRPQHPRRLSSRLSTATPCVRSLGPSHRSPTLPPVTASMMVNSRQGKHLGPWNLWLWAPWGRGLCVTLFSALTLATYLLHESLGLGLWVTAESHGTLSPPLAVCPGNLL